MAKLEKNTLGYLGMDYQERLMAHIITDTNFGNSIIDIIKPDYFEDPYLRIIAATIKEAKEEYDIIPDFGSLKIRLMENVKEEVQQKYVIKQISNVEKASLNDAFKVQDIAMKFCKQQELKKSIKEIQKIIDKGDIEDYEECELILRKALEHGDAKDDGVDVFSNIRDILKEDFRKPIPTGIKGLDEIMDGGLSKGELAVILAPFGVGKTTMMTKIANTALNEGYKVLQIFFEDNVKVIQRKHVACWTGIELGSLSMHADEIVEFCEKKLAESKAGKAQLKLKKFPSDGTTIPMIRQYIRKKMSEGFRPDVVLLDYIDVVAPSKAYTDSNVAEGSVMRQFEAMLSELDMAGWTAVQGNRSSIKANVVEADQMGGSIKKGQIGHFIVSIAKTLEQKETAKATMAILKSRFGKDGIVFEDITFDNARIQIDMGTCKSAMTKTQYKQNNNEAARDADNQRRVNELMESRNRAINTN